MQWYLQKSTSLRDAFPSERLPIYSWPNRACRLPGSDCQKNADNHQKDGLDEQPVGDHIKNLAPQVAQHGIRHS